MLNRESPKTLLAPQMTASAALPTSVPATVVDVETNRDFGNLANLTRGGWKIISVQSDKPCDTDGDGTETRDVRSEMPACALDDVMMVRENGKVFFKRHERCELTEHPVETYDWTLAQDGTFTMRAGSIEGVMQLRYVTGRRLVMVIPMEAQGEAYHFTVTYEQTEPLK